MHIQFKYDLIHLRLLQEWDIFFLKPKQRLGIINRVDYYNALILISLQ